MTAGEKFGLVVILFALLGILFMHLADGFTDSDWLLLIAAATGAVIFVYWK